MLMTNVTGLINMTQAILPIMLKRGASGSGDIVNIGSIAGREGYPGGSVYCASKAAVRAFTDALRKELIASRVRIIEIDPGQVETVSASYSRCGNQNLTYHFRSFRSCDSTDLKRRPMQYMRMSCPVSTREKTNVDLLCYAAAALHSPQKILPKSSCSLLAAMKMSLLRIPSSSPTTRLVSPSLTTMSNYLRTTVLMILRLLGRCHSYAQKLVVEMWV